VPYRADRRAAISALNVFWWRGLLGLTPDLPRMTACKDGQFNTVGQTVALQQAANVVAHRVGADGQAGRYCFIAQAMR